MNGLAIDTSTYVLGVAVVKDGEVVGEFMTNLKKNHSLRLMSAIRTLMEEAEMTPKQLDRIIVAQGPGSYTGVRIGVTTAKTMAWALQIPVVGVSSLKILAQYGRYFTGVISPFFDARRGQVYTGLYRMSNGLVENIRPDQIILHHDWLSALKDLGEQVLFVSPDMTKHQETIEEVLGKKAIFGQKTENLLRPGELALLGMNQDVSVNTHEFAPNYIRLAEAEAKWLAARQGEQKENKGE